MLRIARFKPTPPDNPPLEASDRKKEKGRRTEEAANDERNRKNKRIQSEHLFAGLPDGIIRSEKQLSRNDEKAFGSCRFLYNRMLTDRVTSELTGEYIKITPAVYKKEFPWLREVDSLALCNTYGKKGSERKVLCFAALRST